MRSVNVVGAMAEIARRSPPALMCSHHRHYRGVSFLGIELVPLVCSWQCLHLIYLWQTIEKLRLLQHVRNTRMERKALHVYLLILCIHLSQRLVSELKLALDIVVCLFVLLMLRVIYIARQEVVSVICKPRSILRFIYLSYFYLIFILFLPLFPVSL